MKKTIILRALSAVVIGAAAFAGIKTSGNVIAESSDITNGTITITKENSHSQPEYETGKHLYVLTANGNRHDYYFTSSPSAEEGTITTLNRSCGMYASSTNGAIQTILGITINYTASADSTKLVFNFGTYSGDFVSHEEHSAESGAEIVPSAEEQAECHYWSLWSYGTYDIHSIVIRYSCSYGA